jgi:hypothetical protein
LELPDAIHPDWPFDILYPAFTSILEREARMTLQLVADAARDVYPARFRKALQTRRDIDAVAVNVSILDDDVAGIDADTQLDPTIGRDAGIVSPPVRISRPRPSAILGANRSFT